MMSRHDGVWVLKLVAMSIGLVLMGFQLGGCGGPSYGRHELEVCLSDQLKGKTVEVDVVGVMNDQDVATWQAQNVTKYFSAGDSSRREAAGRQEFRFSAGDSGCKKVLGQDPMWDGAWKGARSVVILANIPFLESEGGKPTDPRRAVITLQRGVWENDHVQIQVGESGVKVLTPQKQPK